jgi:uncharacterized membrane protein YjjP (DUF1212 family)
VTVPLDPDGDELSLIRDSGIALRAGQLSLSAGTGSYRVKATMVRVARSLGIERQEAHVTLTEITASSYRGVSFRTQVAEVRRIGIDARRLAELEDLASSLEAVDQRSTPEAVTKALDEIQNRPLLYGAVTNAVASGAACAGFAFLIGGLQIEVLAAFVGATVGQFVRRQLLHRKVNAFGVTMIAAAVACLTYLGVVNGLFGLGVTDAKHEAGYVASALFLVPGFPLVTAALDLAKLDFSAGLSRLTYALMVLTSAAISLWGVSELVGLSPITPEHASMDPWLLFGLRLIASFVAVVGFAVIFNSPWRMFLGAAVVGTVANQARLALVDVGVVAQAAAAVAALLVGLLAALVAPRLRVPRITIYVPAVVIMVPGTAAYQAVFYSSNGDTVQALAYAVQAGLIVVALAIGLAVARMVTDPTWTFER